MKLREGDLEKQNNRLAVMRSTGNKSIIIRPNNDVKMKRFLDKLSTYQPTCAILQTSASSVIPSDINITPILVSSDAREDMRINVHISKVTTRTVSVHPREIMCELQPVRIEDMPFDTPTENDNLISQKNTIRQFIDIFSSNECDVGHTDRLLHEINLLDDHPFKQRHHRIPPSMYQEVRNHLHN